MDTRGACGGPGDLDAVHSGTLHGDRLPIMEYMLSMDVARDPEQLGCSKCAFLGQVRLMVTIYCIRFRHCGKSCTYIALVNHLYIKVLFTLFSQEREGARG